MHPPCMKRLPVLLLTCALSPALLGIDQEFLRAWESAQKKRPAAIGTIGTIAPPSEPGTPLTIRGRVLSQGGEVVKNAIVFAWQTDASGAYDRRGTPAHSWRLRGWVRTDAKGAFTFHTIRPAAYPNHREPAHVHFTVETVQGARYFANDLMFADDPLLQDSAKAAQGARVTTTKGRQEVALTLRLDPRNRF